MNKKAKWDKADLLIILIFIVVFGGFFFGFPPNRVDDTFQHENQFITREPVYALLIQFLKVLFPSEEGYYRPLSLIQNVLAIIANSTFVIFLKNKFQISKWSIPILIGIALLPHIMTPVCSHSHLILTNSLMTEGIAMSVFLIFTVFLLKTMWEEEDRRRNSLITLLLALFASLIRGQLMTLMIVWAIVMGYLVITNIKQLPNRRITFFRMAAIAVLLAVAFLTRIYTCRIYNYLEKGIFTDTASSKAMAVANVLYVAEREDGEGIEDPGIRELFYEIYDAMDEDGVTAKSSGKGLIARAVHHEDNHELINFDYFTDQTKDYIRDTTGVYVEQYMQLMVDVDVVADKMMKGLLPRCFDRYLYNYIAMITMGFIRSVAIINPVLNWYALLFYLLAIITTFYLWKKDRHSKAASFMAVSLLMICGNVTATSMIIQCISRYMFFTFPLVYSAAWMMLVELIRNRKRNGEK